MSPQALWLGRGGDKLGAVVRKLFEGEALTDWAVTNITIVPNELSYCWRVLDEDLIFLVSSSYIVFDLS